MSEIIKATNAVMSLITEAQDGPNNYTEITIEFIIKARPGKNLNKLQKKLVKFHNDFLPRGILFIIDPYKNT